MSLRTTLPHRLPFFYGWLVVACVMLGCYARQGAAVATLSIFVTPMSTEFGWSRTAISGAVSLGGLLGGLLSPALGPFIDRHGARSVLIVSSLVMGATCFALAGTQSLLWFYIAFGIGRLTFAAPFDIGLSAPVANWFVRKRARAMGMLAVSIGAGLAVMPLMAQLVTDAFGWRTGWLAVGLSVLIAGVVPSALFMVRRPEDVGLRPDGDCAQTPPRATSSAARVSDVGDSPAGAGGPMAAEVSYDLRGASRTPAFWLLLVYTAAMFVTQAGISLHQAPHFVHRGLDPTVAAGVVSVFSIAAAVSSLAFGYLGGRWPVRYGLVLTALLTSLAAALTTSAHTVGAAYVSATVFGLGMGGLMTLSVLSFADYFGRQSFGAIRGVAVPVQAAGQAFGPLFSGLMFDLHGGYEVAFMAYAGLALLAAVVGLCARPPAVECVPGAAN